MDEIKLKRIVDCAAKREKCDLVIKNVKIFNVFTGETEEGEIAVADGKIAAVGFGYEGNRVYDGQGRYALPSFIDSHIHEESSSLTPEEFARIAVPHGTGAIVADPHEITNVCGIEGAEYVKEAFARIDAGGVAPLDVYLQLPSCVPATPFETSGAVLDARETAREIQKESFFGLGEMMNYPAVISGDRDVLAKIAAAHRAGKIVDGHAPALTGGGLNAYLAAGISTDHESLTASECREKVGRGQYVQIRCGSTANNVRETVSAVDGFNFRRFLACSDDKNARELLDSGHMDHALASLVQSGLEAKYAVTMATINAAECYGMKGKGAIAPSYDADIVLVGDMKAFRVHAVFKRGVLVAENGKALFSVKPYLPSSVKDTVRIGKADEETFRLPAEGRVRVITVFPKSLYTGEEIVSVRSEAGDVVLPDGVNKLAVIERHFASGRRGLALVKGFSLKGGAIAGTYAHDSHNLVVLGDNNRDMARAAALVKEAGGGMAVVSAKGEEVFPLDVGGIMSSLPAEEVVKRSAQIQAAAHALGIPEETEPFMALSFLSLPVIARLKLTDRGLVDVDNFRLTTVEVI